MNDDAALESKFIAALPFALTGAQRRVLEDVRSDLARDLPMNAAELSCISFQIDSQQQRLDAKPVSLVKRGRQRIADIGGSSGKERLTKLEHHAERQADEQRARE